MKVKGHIPVRETALFSKVTSKTLSEPQRGGYTVVHIIPAGGGTSEKKCEGRGRELIQDCTLTEKIKIQLNNYRNLWFGNSLI